MLKNHMTKATWYECIPKSYSFSCGKAPKHIHFPSSTFSNVTFILSQYIDVIGNFFSQMKPDFCLPHLHIAFYTTTTLLSSIEIVVLFQNYLNRFSFNLLGNVRSWKHQTKLLFLEKKEWSVHYLIFTLHTCNWVVAKKCLAKPLRCHISCKYQQWQKSNYF